MNNTGISVDTFAAYLRIDAPAPGTAEHTELGMLLDQARGVCEDFTRVKFDTYEGDPPTAVQQAVLLLASHRYAYREPTDESAEMSVKKTLDALLYPHSDEEKMF